MSQTENWEGNGAAFYAGSRSFCPAPKDFISVLNTTSGAIVRFQPVPLDSESIQVRSGTLGQPGGVSYQLLSGTVKNGTSRWGVAMEPIPAQGWGRIQVCGVAVVSTVTSLGNGSAAAVSPVNGGVSYCDIHQSATARVLTPGSGCAALVILDDRGDHHPLYNGYFKLVDASTYDEETGELISAAVRVLNGADSSGVWCGLTDLPGSADKVSATTLNMSGGTVSLYGWYDRNTSAYCVGIDSSRASASAAGSGYYSEFQLGHVFISAGKLAVVQDWQGGPVYFSVRYVI